MTDWICGAQHLLLLGFNIVWLVTVCLVSLNSLLCRVREVEFSPGCLHLIWGFLWLGLCCDPWFLGSTQFLEGALSLDNQTHLTQRIVQETFICNDPTRAELCTFLSVSQQVVSHVKSVAHTMFPSTTVMFFSFNNSSMCHLFLFPIWLFLNLPDKVLLLVRAAHSRKVATWWCREVLQSKSVFCKQFLLCCRVMKWLQCLLGSCDDWIDPSSFYYPLESSDWLLCISQHHFEFWKGKELSVTAFWGSAPVQQWVLQWKLLRARSPSHKEHREFGCSGQGGGTGVGFSCSCAVSLHQGMGSMASSISLISVLGCSALFVGNSSHFLSRFLGLWMTEEMLAAFLELGWAALQQVLSQV